MYLVQAYGQLASELVLAGSCIRVACNRLVVKLDRHGRKPSWLLRKCFICTSSHSINKMCLFAVTCYVKQLSGAHLAAAERVVAIRRA
jgi:hypothetical protein